MFTLAFSFIGAYIIYQATAAPKPKTPSNQVSLSLEPASQKVPVGTVLTLSVWVDSYDQPVNAVQANLSYPADKYDFVNIDASLSAFGIEAQASGGNGSVNIARGQVGSISGHQLLAKINLLAKDNNGSSSVSFSGGSAVVRSTDNVNILNQTKGGRYTLSR